MSWQIAEREAGMKICAVLAVGLFFAAASAFGQTRSNWACADDFIKSEGDKGMVFVSMGVSRGLAQKKVLPNVSGLEHSNIKSDVAVKVLIGKDGMVRCAEAVEGHSDLWVRSAEAAKQWQFRPYLLNGKTVIIETMIRFAFNKKKVSVLY